MCIDRPVRVRLGVGQGRAGAGATRKGEPSPAEPSRLALGDMLLTLPTSSNCQKCKNVLDMAC